MPKPNIPTRDYHPAVVERSSTPTKRRKVTVPSIKLPKNKNTLDVEIGDRVVKLTNLNKLFWPKLGVTKRDLIQYYLDIAPEESSRTRLRCASNVQLSKS